MIGLPIVGKVFVKSFAGVQGAVFQKSPLAAGGIKTVSVAACSVSGWGKERKWKPGA